MLLVPLCFVCLHHLGKNLCCFIFLNYPKCITWFMHTSLCNFWLMCFSFTEDFWLCSFHCMFLFFVLLGFVFPCNTLPAVCLSGCQQECFSCVVLCLAALYMTDSWLSRLVLPDPGEFLETCAAPFPNGWGFGERVCLLEMAAWLLIVFLPWKESVVQVDRSWGTI